MKYFGEKPTKTGGSAVFKRPGGKDIIFTIKPVPNFDDFNRMVPRPKPPHVIKPGGVKVERHNDPKFIEAQLAYIRSHADYVVLKSISETEGLEWDNVSLDDPGTWSNWHRELLDANLLMSEINYLVEQVQIVNALDETKLNEARDSFLAGQQAL